MATTFDPAAYVDGCVRRTAGPLRDTHFGLLPTDLQRLVVAYKTWPTTALTAELTESVNNLECRINNYYTQPSQPHKRAAPVLTAEQFREAIQDEQCRQLYHKRRLLQQQWSARCNGGFGRGVPY